MARVAPGATAFPWRTAQWCAQLTARWQMPEDRDSTLARLERVRQVAQEIFTNHAYGERLLLPSVPWLCMGRVRLPLRPPTRPPATPAAPTHTVNYIEGSVPLEAYYGDNLGWLRRLKAEVDPDCYWWVAGGAMTTAAGAGYSCGKLPTLATGGHLAPGASPCTGAPRSPQVHQSAVHPAPARLVGTDVLDTRQDTPSMTAAANV